MNKLILGTASFGKPYGIKGDPVPDEKELEKIARTAWDGGIKVIHTSWQYNLPKICEAIFSEFDKIEKHRINPDLFKWNDRKGRVCYEPVGNTGQIVQIPSNILDGRWTDFIYEARKNKTEIHARSVFLQGLLLMEELPAWVSTEARWIIKAFHHACRAMRLYAYEAALGYVLGLDEIDKVIVGVNSSKQLEQLLTVKPLRWEYDFHIDDENILDPRRWPQA